MVRLSLLGLSTLPFHWFDFAGEFRDWSLTLYGTEIPAQPEDPVTAGAPVTDGSAVSGGVSVEHGDKSHNEVDIPRQVTFPKGSSNAWVAGNAESGIGSGGGRVGFGGSGLTLLAGLGAWHACSRLSVVGMGRLHA